MKKSIMLTALLLLGMPWDLRAEEPRPVAIGDRVRLTVPTLGPQPLVATMVGLSGDTLDIHVKGQLRPVSVSRSAVTRLERSRGRAVGKGAGIGFVVGLAAGLLTSAIVCSGGDCEGMGYLVFGGGGIVLGPLIGAVAGSGERWTEVGPPPRISSASPAAVTRGGIKVSFRF